MFYTQKIGTDDNGVSFSHDGIDDVLKQNDGIFEKKVEIKEQNKKSATFVADFRY